MREGSCGERWKVRKTGSLDLFALLHEIAKVLVIRLGTCMIDEEERVRFGLDQPGVDRIDRR